jgi:hypothetical protein
MRAYMDRREVLMERAGDHSSFKISRQIAPVYEDMFGCHILVSNYILGGL